MDEIHIAEQQLLALITETEQDRDRAEQRRLAAERAVTTLDEQLAMLRGTLDIYRRKHGLPAPERTPVNSEQAAAYYHKSIREIVHLWLDQHNDEVVLKEMYRYLVDIGLFKDVGEAHGAFSRIFARMPDLTRITRGIYRRQRAPAPESAPDVPAPPPEPPTPPPSVSPVDSDWDRWEAVAQEDEGEDDAEAPFDAVPLPRPLPRGAPTAPTTLPFQARATATAPTLRGLPVDVSRG